VFKGTHHDGEAINFSDLQAIGFPENGSLAAWDFGIRLDQAHHRST
jgi:hypothetical protein